MYPPIICDCCGEPIIPENEPAYDGKQPFRVTIETSDGRRMGLDLHQACAVIVDRAWRAFVQRAAARPTAL